MGGENDGSRGEVYEVPEERDFAICEVQLLTILGNIAETPETRLIGTHQVMKSDEGRFQERQYRANTVN